MQQQSQQPPHTDIEDADRRGPDTEHPGLALLYVREGVKVTKPIVREVYPEHEMMKHYR
jgi:hypothetical protein